MRKLYPCLLVALLLACAPTADELHEPELPSIENADAVTWESFACGDEFGANCGPINRYDNRWMQLSASQWTDFGSSYNKSDFSIYNTSGLWRQITRHSSTGSTDALQWTFAFPSGSPCNTGGNCLFSLCLDGVACHETTWRTGATGVLNGVWFAPYQTRRLTVYYRVLNGGSTHTTEERLNIWHTPL